MDKQDQKDYPIGDIFKPRQKGDTMTNTTNNTRKGYNVTAFDREGGIILVEHVTSKAAARVLAKDYARHSNVGTVDVDDACYGTCGNVLYRVVKTGIRSAFVVEDGEVKNIRL